MEKEKIAELIDGTKKGNPDAAEELITYAHTQVSYICRSMMKNEQDAEDLTQEVLMAMYSRLDTLQNPNAFRSWLDRITVRMCANALNRTHVDLQFTVDDDGNSAEDLIEDENAWVIPEQALDNTETVRMVGEMVQSLSQEQRICTLMYYFDEVSVRDIAETLQVPENTVKSRLNYARKALKQKFLDLEKQGIRLYNVSLLPMLSYFLRSYAQLGEDKAQAARLAAAIAAPAAAAAPAGAAVSSAASAKAAAGTTAVKTAAAAKAAAGGLTVKITAFAAAAAIVVGGIAVGTKMEKDPLPTEPTLSVCEQNGHKLSSATCTEAARCIICDEIQGEPLGHRFGEATCETAQICEVCGESQGEPLGHDWLPANYEDPEICKVCGASQGKVLTPELEALGISCNMQPGEEYTYCARCSGNREEITEGKVSTTGYAVSASYGDTDAPEGFEWRSATFNFRFSDRNAQRYGASWFGSVDNYYRVARGFEDQTGAAALTASILYHGEEMVLEGDASVDFQWNERGDELTVTMSVAMQVPVDYDGFLFVLYSTALDPDEDIYLPDYYDGSDDVLVYRFG